MINIWITVKMALIPKLKELLDESWDANVSHH